MSHHFPVTFEHGWRRQQDADVVQTVENRDEVVVPRILGQIDGVGGGRIFRPSVAILVSKPDERDEPPRKLAPAPIGKTAFSTAAALWLSTSPMAPP